MGRLTKFLEDNNLLSNEQNGFRKKRSCLDRIYSLSEVVRNRMNSNKPTFAAFIDFRKVFDCVNRTHLFQKLKLKGISGRMLNAVICMYKNTMSSILLENYMTDWFLTNNGVRQGDTLSPTLFAIFIDDLVRCLNSLNQGVQIRDKNLATLLYADDLVIIASNEEDLQHMLCKLNEWCTQWKMEINESKSKVIHFCRKYKQQSEYCFTVGAKILNYESSYKYLGIWVNEFCDFSKTEKLLSESGDRALGKVVGKFKGMKNMGYNTYTKLYNACVATILNYGVGVWGAYSNGQMSEKNSE